MPTGYEEFELALMEAIERQLVPVMERLQAAPLTEQNIGTIPTKAQGVYLLSYNDELKYIGKTDAEAGFQQRLTRHFYNIQQRQNLDPTKVTFKAVRVAVFTAMNIETMLIGHYGGRLEWNNSGFGSNDPGRRRETQEAAQFDRQYPIDIDQPAPIEQLGSRKIKEVLVELKNRLPYLLRYERSPTDHETLVTIQQGTTVRQILVALIQALPSGWQATVFPARLILYKEDRRYREMIDRFRRSPVI